MSTYNNRTIHAEISTVPVGTSSTSISKEVAAAFDAIRKTKGIKTSKLTAMGTQLEANSMRPILDAIEAAHEAVKSTGAKRIISIPFNIIPLSYTSQQIICYIQSETFSSIVLCNSLL